MSIWFGSGHEHRFTDLRAGWRLAVFLVLMAPLVLLLWAGSAATAPGGSLPPTLTAAITLESELAVFVWAALATWIMSRLERKPFGHYGLPGQAAFRWQFWLGALWGAIALSSLVLMIAACGDLSLGPVALSPMAGVGFGLEWALAALSIGLCEEFLCRGYVLTTVASGMNFWTGALLISIPFGALHLLNGGEDAFGGLCAVLIGLFFCFTWRRTGNLWFAVGLHAAWDYFQSFVYGTPDSGSLARHRLFIAHISGKAFLSGGSVGPEGSVFVLGVIAALFYFFNRSFPSARASVPAQSSGG